MECEGLSNIIAWISYCSLSLAMHQSHKQLCRGETEGLPSADTRCWAGLGWAGLGWAGRGNVHYEGGGEYPEYQNYDDQLLIFISDEVASRGGWVWVGVFCLHYRKIAIFRHYI